MSLTWPVLVPDALAAVPPWSTATESDRESARAQAVTTLWALTGRVLGTQPVVVRPVFGPPDSHTTYSGIEYSGVGAPVVWSGLLAGNPLVTGSCGCSDPRCNCRDDFTQLVLPGPVAEVTEVLIDGEVLDPSKYRVRSRRWLRRVDGGIWPQAQDLNAVDDELGAFTVRYVRGLPVARAGQLAAGILAVEVLRGIIRGSTDCSLPFGVTSIDREGVSIQLDPAQVLEDGLTGLDKVDRWIMAVNPYKRKQPSRVIVPGQRRTARFS